MHGDVSELMGLKERLDSREQQTGDARPAAPYASRAMLPEATGERPGAALDPRSHAGDVHNRRRGFESVRIHYGNGASISLPYIGMGAIDAPTPGTLVLEHSHRTIIITGVRLDVLHTLLEQRQVEAVGVASDDDSAAYVIDAIRVEKDGGGR